MDGLLGLCLIVAVAFAVYGSLGRRDAPRPRTPPSAGDDAPLPSLRLDLLAGARPRFDPQTAAPAPGPRTLEGSAYVTDGDTIVIDRTTVRLFGIDAPELDHPYGQRAKWAMVRLCKGQTVRAEVTDTDAHGRTVAICTLPDGRDLSAELVRQGLALDWAKFSGGRYRSIETSDARSKLWLADARQKGRMQVWAQYEAKRGRPEPHA